jgi:hypothetical protein
LLQRLHLLQRDVARGHVDVEHPRQDELQRAALGAHHQVNAFQVALKARSSWVDTSSTSVMAASPRVSSNRLSAAASGATTGNAMPMRLFLLYFS